MLCCRPTIIDRQAPKRGRRGVDASARVPRTATNISNNNKAPSY